MSAPTPGLDVRDAPAPADVQPDADSFLDTLAGPTIFRRAGRTPGRTRVVAGTLHGNESSGLRAIHAALRSEVPPAVDTLFFIGAVEAARTPPRYSNRMLPGRRDLNRCFRAPFEGPDGAVAAAALDVLRSARPEAVIDLHNNSGRNPAYGVSAHLDGTHLGLVSLFAERVVHSTLALGTFMEAFEGQAPAITAECGRAGTPEADAAASAGLERFLRLERIDAIFISSRPMSVLTDPVRVCLSPLATVAFAPAPVAGASVTLDDEIDRHNFESVAAEMRLGWVSPGEPWPLVALDATGTDISRRLFHLDGKELRTRATMVPIMMTTDAVIARADCLFYAAHRRQ